MREVVMKPKLIGMVVLLVGVLMLAGSPASYARGDGGEVRKTGSCSKNSDWKIKLKKDDGGKIEVEFEVDQNRNGDTWKVVLKHNGVRFFKDTRVTKAPSGSFTVQKLINNASGDDVVRARARNTRTDELCTGRATI
jgi:hypothetical protein